MLAALHVAAIKLPDEKQLKEGRDYSGSCFEETQSIVVGSPGGRSVRQMLTLPLNSENRDESRSILFSSLGPQAMERHHSDSGWVSHLQLTHPGSTSTVTPRGIIPQ